MIGLIAPVDDDDHNGNNGIVWVSLGFLVGEYSPKAPKLGSRGLGLGRGGGIVLLSVWVFNPCMAAGVNKLLAKKNFVAVLKHSGAHERFFTSRAGASPPLPSLTCTLEVSP